MKIRQMKLRWNFLKFISSMLTCIIVFSPAWGSGIAPELNGPDGLNQAGGWLAGRSSTLAWKGDLIIIGGSLPGVAMAKLAAGMKKKVLLIEPGPVLGTELSAQWDMLVPAGWFANELAQICAPQGGCKDGRFDPFIATLAFDRMMESAGVYCLVCTLPIRPVAGADGMLSGVEIVGKSGRQLVTAPLVVDASPGAAFAFRAAGLSAPMPSALTRRIYVHGIPASGLPKRISVPESLQFSGNRVEIKPAVWPQEVILEFSLLPSADTG